MSNSKYDGKLALESIKNKASKDLMQLIYQASQGQEYVNINLARELINNIVTASCLENQLLMTDIISKK